MILVSSFAYYSNELLSHLIALYSMLQVVELKVRLHCKACEKSVRQSLCRIAGIYINVTVIINQRTIYVIKCMHGIYICRCKECGNRRGIEQDNSVGVYGSESCC